MFPVTKAHNHFYDLYERAQVSHFFKVPERAFINIILEPSGGQVFPTTNFFNFLFKHEQCKSEMSLYCWKLIQVCQQEMELPISKV